MHPSSTGKPGSTCLRTAVFCASDSVILPVLLGNQHNSVSQTQLSVPARREDAARGAELLAAGDGPEAARYGELGLRQNDSDIAGDSAHVARMRARWRRRHVSATRPEARASAWRACHLNRPATAQAQPTALSPQHSTAQTCSNAHVRSVFASRVALVRAV